MNKIFIVIIIGVIILIYVVWMTYAIIHGFKANHKDSKRDEHKYKIGTKVLYCGNVRCTIVAYKRVEKYPVYIIRLEEDYMGLKQGNIIDAIEPDLETTHS